MVFEKIIKMADAHVANMMKNKSMQKKKRWIAKYSYLAGFKTAMALLRNDERSI